MVESMREFRNLLGIVAAASLLGAGAVLADGGQSAEPELSNLEQSPGPELPEAVAELVEAMSGVQRVEPIGSGKNTTFAIHRRMQVTGSRLTRDVTLLVAKDGTIMDWGRSPLSVRIYTRRDIQATGQVDLAEGLEQLDPSIQSNGRH